MTIVGAAVRGDYEPVALGVRRGGRPTASLRMSLQGVCCQTPIVTRNCAKSSTIHVAKLAEIRQQIRAEALQT